MPILSEPQRRQFLDDGHLRVDDVLDADDLRFLLSLYDRAFDPEIPMPGLRRHSLGGVEDGREVLPQVLHPSKALPELRDAPFQARLLQLAREALGPDAELSHDHMIMKPAGYGAPTPWHQDQAYHPPTHRFRNLNIWMPLADATEANGCLHFVTGSHLGPVLPHHVVETPGGHALCATNQDYWSANSVAVPCPAGSVTLHHSYMMHYANANATDQPRRAYIAVFKCPPLPLAKPLVFPWQTAKRQA